MVITDQISLVLRAHDLQLGNTLLDAMSLHKDYVGDAQEVPSSLQSFKANLCSIDAFASN